MASLQDAFGSFGSAISDFGGAASDLMSAGAARSAAANYGEAATLAEQNVSIEQSATAIKLAQNKRAMYKTLSSVSAGAGANGIATKGSACDILRETVQQGSLASGLIGTQGAINENSYAAQAGAFKSQQTEANALANAKQGGGIMSALSGVGNIVSGIFGLF